MATLTEVSVMARKGIKYGIIGLVVMAMIPGAFSMLRKIILAFNPPPPPAPTVRYGKLPKLMFPEVPNFATPEYKLETITGSFPALKNTGKVYLVGVNKARLLVLDRMKARMRTVDMNPEPVQLDEKTYRFLHAKEPIDLLFDSITGGFSYKYDWTTNKAIYTSRDVLIGDQAIARAKSFLQKLGGLPIDLAKGDGKNGLINVTYWAATNSAMVPAVSAYEANFVRVDLFRDNKDEMKIVTVGGNTSPVNVIMSGLPGTLETVQANFHYSQILDDDFATYPLKSVETAWRELVSGGGFISRRTAEKTVVVRKASLAYFEANEQQLFMQPVFVFEGDAGFVAYVQAVDPSYVTDFSK